MRKEWADVGRNKSQYGSIRYCATKWVNYIFEKVKKVLRMRRLIIKVKNAPYAFTYIRYTCKVKYVYTLICTCPYKCTYF